MDSTFNFKPNENFKYYMYFLSERMNIFWNRFEGKSAPYTEDKIFQEHKFTNVYRVLDRSSQYLLKNVIYNGNNYAKEDMVFRVLLYKYFNLPSTWDSLIKKFGDIDSSTKEEDIVEYFKILVSNGETLYSNAYMITASFMRSDKIMSKFGLINGDPKYKSYMRLLYKGLYEDGIMESILNSKSLKQGFDSILKFVGVADFLGYQYVQDLNYTEFFDFDDNEFCAAGPGTIRGVERCFEINGRADYGHIVKWVHSNFEQLCEDYSVNFRGLKNHLPTVPDLSNCFCEVDKYLRGLGVSTEGKNIYGKRIKQSFKENPSKIDYFFPPKWGVSI